MLLGLAEQVAAEDDGVIRAHEHSQYISAVRGPIGLAVAGGKGNRGAQEIAHADRPIPRPAFIISGGETTVTLRGDSKGGRRYRSAAFTIANALLREPYLSADSKHQGMILHSIYHRPNDWDHVPKGSKIPYGESSMWGDYHAMELVHLIRREAENSSYPVFFQ